MIDEYARPNFKMIENIEKDDKMKTSSSSLGKSKSKQTSSTPSNSKQKQYINMENFETEQIEIPKKLSFLDPLESLHEQEEKQKQNKTQHSLAIQQKEKELLKIQEQLMQIEQQQRELEAKQQQKRSQLMKQSKSKNDVIVIGNEVYLESSKKSTLESENNRISSNNNEQLQQKEITKESTSKSKNDKKERNENLDNSVDFSKTSKSKEIIRIEGQQTPGKEEGKLDQTTRDARGDATTTKEQNNWQELHNEAKNKMEIEQDKSEEREEEQQLTNTINRVENEGVYGGINVSSLIQNLERQNGEVNQKQDAEQRHNLDDIGVEVEVNQLLSEENYQGKNEDEFNLENPIGQDQIISQIEEETHKITLENKGQKEELNSYELRKEQQKQVNELLSQFSGSDYEDLLSEQKQVNQSDYDVLEFSGSEGELFGDSQECDLKEKKLAKKYLKSGEKEYMKTLRDTERFIREEEQERQRLISSRDLRKQQQHELTKNIRYLDDNEEDLDLLFSENSQDSKQFSFGINSRMPSRLSWQDFGDDDDPEMKYAKRSRKGKWKFQRDEWESDKLSRLEEFSKEWEDQKLLKQQEGEKHYQRQNQKRQRYQDEARENEINYGDNSQPQQQQSQLRRSARHINKPAVMNFYQNQYYRSHNTSSLQNRRTKISNGSEDIQESEQKNKQKGSFSNKRKRGMILGNNNNNSPPGNSSESLKETKKKKVCVDRKQLNYTYSSDSSIYSQGEEEDTKQLKEGKNNSKILQKQQHESRCDNRKQQSDKQQFYVEENTFFDGQDDSFDILSENEDQKEINGIDQILKGIEGSNDNSINNQNISDAFQEIEEEDDDDLPCDLPELGEDQVINSLSKVTENLKERVKQQELEFLENNLNLQKYTVLNKTNFQEKNQEEIVRLKARKLFLQASLQERYELQLKLYQQSLTQFSAIDRKSIPKKQPKNKLNVSKLNCGELQISSALRETAGIDNKQGILTKYSLNSNSTASKSIPLILEPTQLGGQYCQQIVKYQLAKSYQPPRMHPPPSFMCNLVEF